MKNFKRRNSYGHHGSKRRALVQYVHSPGSHSFSRTFINTVTTTLCEVPDQLLHNLESNFILKVSEGGVANQSTR